MKNIIIRCPYLNGFIDDETILEWKRIVEKREEETIIQGQSATDTIYTCHCRAKYLDTKSGETFLIQMRPWCNDMAQTNLKTDQAPHLCKASMHSPSKKDYLYLKEKLKPRKEFESDD